MFKKIISLAFFAFVLCIKSYSQDSAGTHKVLYKISPGKAKVAARKQDAAILPVAKKSVYSCETNTKTNRAVISTVPANGMISKETYEIKEDKK